MKLIIHDMAEEDFKKIFPQVPEDTQVISDNGKILACVGCFGCWIKTPGTCVLKDGYENIGKTVTDAEKMLVLCKVTYGSYSPFIKTVLDRSLSSSLPFFEIVGSIGRHPRRYESKAVEPPVLIFYGDDITAGKKETLQRLADHIFQDGYTIHFCSSLEEVAKEVSAV